MTRNVSSTKNKAYNGEKMIQAILQVQFEPISCKSGALPKRENNESIKKSFKRIMHGLSFAYVCMSILSMTSS